MASDLIREWIDGWNAHDPDRVAAVFTADCLYEDVTFGVVMRNADDIRGFVNLFVAVVPDCHFELERSFLTDAFGGAEWTCSGTHRGDMPGMPATGKAFTLRGSSIMEVRDGRFTRCADYWDMATFMRQLGFLPAS